MGSRRAGSGAGRKRPTAKTDTASIDETSNRLFFRFFQASNTLQTKATQALDEFGVTATQWSVLGALSRDQSVAGMSITEMSDYLLVSRQNLAGVLGRMEREGWLERSVDPNDGRSRIVTLTVVGRELWESLAAPIHEFYEHALRDFGEQDRLDFIRSITMIQRSMAEPPG